MKVEEKNGVEYVINDGKMYFTFDGNGNHFSKEDLDSAIEVFECAKCGCIEEVDFNARLADDWFPVGNAQKVGDKTYCLDCYLKEAKKYITKPF